MFFFRVFFNKIGIVESIIKSVINLIIVFFLCSLLFIYYGVEFIGLIILLFILHLSSSYIYLMLRRFSIITFGLFFL